MLVPVLLTSLSHTHTRAGGWRRGEHSTHKEMSSCSAVACPLLGSLLPITCTILHTYYIVLVGGLRLPKVLKKHNLIIFSKYNMWTGTFGVRLRVYKSVVKTKLDWNEKRSWWRIRRSRSYVQKGFGTTTEKKNRLKDEKPNWTSKNYCSYW
jgi:hypothetical protein